MNDVLSILDRLAATASKNEKIEILRRANSLDLRRVIKAALDPYVMFYIRQVPKCFSALRSSELNWERIRFRLDTLHKRAVTGHAAVDFVVETLQMLSERDGEVLRRILRKDLRCGVGAKIVNSVWPGMIPEFKVQLATPKFEKLTFPCYGEPKHDGMRVITFVGKTPETTTFVSRNGLPVETLKLDQIAVDVCESFAPGSVLDGEAKSGGFQRSMSVVKRSGKNKLPDKMTYTIFDMLTREEWDARECKRTYEKRRGDLVGVRKEGDTLATLENVRIRDEAEAVAYYKQCRAAGHEGAIFKPGHGLYEWKRTAAWVKMKPSETLDVEIEGFKEGKGKYVGMLGAFLFTHNAQVCSAGKGMTDAERKKWWPRRKSLVGTIMEVEFMEETDAGKTRHANFIRLREDKTT